jgi:hypothetical protein
MWWAPSPPSWWGKQHHQLVQGAQQHKKHHRHGHLTATNTVLINLREKYHQHTNMSAIVAGRWSTAVCNTTTTSSITTSINKAGTSSASTSAAAMEAYQIIWHIIKFIQGALALGMAQQVLGAAHNEWLAELPHDLSPQDVEVVGRRGAVDHLPVGVLDLRPQVAAREPFLGIDLSDPPSGPQKETHQAAAAAQGQHIGKGNVGTIHATAAHDPTIQEALLGSTNKAAAAQSMTSDWSAHPSYSHKQQL